MKKILKNIGLSVLLIVLSGPVALSQEDSTDLGFNAMVYSMQKRYRPASEKIFNARSQYVFDKGNSGHMFVTGNVTADLLGDGSVAPYSWLDGVELGLGWRSHQSNAFRLDLSYGQFTRNSDLSGFHRAGIGVEHNFYLNTYLNGYRLFQPFDVYTVAGVGADMFIGEPSRVLAPWMKLGLGAQFKFSGRVSFFLSPQYYIYPVQFVLDNAGGIGNVRARQYRTAFSVKAGVQVDLGKCFNVRHNIGILSSEEAYEHSPEENPMFVSLAVGPQFQNGRAMKETTPLFSSMRLNYSLSVGKWMTSSLGVRLGGFYGKDVWKTIFDPALSQQINLFCNYAGLRAELMIDPFGFGARRHYRSDITFSMPFIIGVEGGKLQKKDYNLNLDFGYLGLSCAIQPHYYFPGRISVFAEPHCSIIPYTFNKVTGGKILGSGENYWDTVFSFSLGVEINIDIRKK